MYLSQFIRRARSLLDANISVELKSPPGIGKSETVADLPEIYSKQDGEEWGFQKMFIATQTPPDLLGYMTVGDRLIEAKPVRVSEFSMPIWMMSDVSGRPLNSYKRGILLLDEWDKGDPDTKRATAELLLNKGLGPWQLHPGIGIIACSNRMEDRSGSTKTYDFIINRRVEYDIQPRFLDWEMWANRNDILPFFKGYASRHIEVIFSGKVPDKQGPFCTPRSFVMLSRVFGKMLTPEGKFNFDDRDERVFAEETALGLVGEAATQSIMSWVVIQTEAPSFDDIVANPMTTPVPEKLDVKSLIVYECAHKVEHKTLGPVSDYIRRLPRDFGLTFAAAAISRDHRLTSHPAMMKWIKENASLIAMVTT